jgi:hypothetical protein
VNTTAEALPGAEATSQPTRVRQPLKIIAKNVFALSLVGACALAYETGYFSADRIVRRDWVALDAYPKDRPGKVVFDATFSPDLLQLRDEKAGSWNLYNGAAPATLSVEGGAMRMTYALAWLGVYFDHKGFEPKALYRVRFEAKVDGEPAAILMRNRQLDYMREQIPTTGGAFKEFVVSYAAPAGRWDQVKIIFMPDGRGKVSGALTIRKFRIERLEN